MVVNPLIYLFIFLFMFAASVGASYSGSNVGITGPGLVKRINFEDGRVPGTMPETQEPARIISQNGNKFLRFIANFGDQQAIPAAKYPDRVRATMYMTAPHWEMPELNSTNKHISYSADIRFIDNKTRRPGYVANSFFELFQASNIYRSTGYDAPDSASGPPVRFIRNQKSHVIFVVVQENGPQKTAKPYDLGYYGPNEFHNYKVDAIWSTNPNEGGYIVYIDGVEKLNLGGCTYFNPRKSNLVPAFKVGLYGTNAVGTVDVDNVEIRNLSNRK